MQNKEGLENNPKSTPIWKPSTKGKGRHREGSFSPPTFSLGFDTQSSPTTKITADVLIDLHNDGSLPLSQGHCSEDMDAVKDDEIWHDTHETHVDYEELYRLEKIETEKQMELVKHWKVSFIAHTVGFIRFFLLVS